MNRWVKASAKLPAIGSIVEVKARKGSCACEGYKILDCYFNGTFFGVKTKVDYWREKQPT